MKPVDELKAERAAVQLRWGTIWVGLVGGCLFIGQILDLAWFPSIIATLVFPFLLFMGIRRGRASEDQFLIFSTYRQYAIIMTSGYAGVQISQTAERAGFVTGIGVSMILLMSVMAGLVGLVLFDHFIARGDNE